MIMSPKDEKNYEQINSVFSKIMKREFQSISYVHITKDSYEKMLNRDDYKIPAVDIILCIDWNYGIPNESQRLGTVITEYLQMSFDIILLGDKISQQYSFIMISNLFINEIRFCKGRIPDNKLSSS